MWIKTPNGELINLDQMTVIVYRPSSDTTGALTSDGNGTGPICSGNAVEIIAQAIQRDQKYLEVNDCD